MIAQACLNGGRPPSYHPAVPVTIQALVEDGRKVVTAGANELHLHVRGEGGVESPAPNYVDATIAQRYQRRRVIIISFPSRSTHIAK